MMPNQHTSRHEFETGTLPTWCPGCGNFALWTALNHVFAQKKWKPHEVMVVFDIGCSGNGSNWIKAYTFHGLHGRAIPLALGIKLANHRLKTIVISGDGAAYGEGLNHFIQTIRANPDMTCIVENNQLYALTKGQVSPTSAAGTASSSTPYGSTDEPLNPLSIALAADCSFVARGFAGDLPYLESIISAALDHRGFSVVDVFQPCVTFNHVNTYAWFYQHVRKIETLKHDPANYTAAVELARQSETFLPIGILYQSQRSTLEDHLPQLKSRPLVDTPVQSPDLRDLRQKLS